MLPLIQKFAADTACTDEGLCTDLPIAGAHGVNLQTIANIVIGTLAVVAVMIIVISALNIVTAGGDPNKVSKARSAIIYALVGLVVVVISEVIVRLVIGKV